MRLVIDLQGMQSTGSRNRGIGRYSTSLTKAILETRGEHDVHVLLNAAFIDTLDLIKAELNELVPEKNVHLWYPVTPISAANRDNDFRRVASQQMRESIIAQLNPDLLLITSLFEGFSDDAALSIGEFTNNIPTVVVMYDLIPLIYKQTYLANPDIERWYLKKIDSIRRATHLLSISASSRREALNYLGFPEHRVTNISAACDSNFAPKEVSKDRRIELAKTYGLDRPFVMYTGGIDYRKNIEGLIRAYANLPESIRCEHQLAVVCSAHPAVKQRLQNLSVKYGLKPNEFIMTGFVPENDLLDIYRICKAFVFPSRHEGFGLPALEAMACGRAVIGANTSSIPEVIGREDALFDPLDDAAIAESLHKVLTDDKYREELEKHGLTQSKKFSWLESAHVAWDALNKVNEQSIQTISSLSERPKLAYVSPIPSAKSGIADYSAELLPELSRHYRIDIIVCQDEPIQDSYIQANYPLRSLDWFLKNVNIYDRVIYHFGNSHFHVHMFDLLEKIPGTVVLHDFFLSGILSHVDVTGRMPGIWSESLLHSHGWPSVIERYTIPDTAETVWKYPSNLRVLQAAQGVIVHSENSRRMAQEWYGSEAAEEWELIPLMRVPVAKPDKAAARRKLEISDDKYVVCSFGLLGRTKLNHRLIKAWSKSLLARNESCQLIFVGQNDGGQYGSDILRFIDEENLNVKITGWADSEEYKLWLTAADAAVQLRTLSRGETSAAVLDCMNYSLPTIVNAHGSMQDISDDVVFKVRDNFSDEELTEALTLIWKNVEKRNSLGQKARHHIERDHQPRACADLYFKAIEKYSKKAKSGAYGLTNSINPETHKDIENMADGLVLNFPPKIRIPTLFIDISALISAEYITGIQRVVRSTLMNYLQHPPSGWKVEPIYSSSNESGYRYARKYACNLLSIPSEWASDSLVEVAPGDRILVIDLDPRILREKKSLLKKWQAMGIRIGFVIYDLLPILLPQHFPDDAANGHYLWLKDVSEFDAVIAISQSVADEYIHWLDAMGPFKKEFPISINYFHLGAEIEIALSISDEVSGCNSLLASMEHNPTLLMVGTLEPRKGHSVVLDAMELLWNSKYTTQLVIVGKKGWMVDDLEERLRHHPEFGRRLYWLEDAGDELLARLYKKAAGLVAASEGEGFGLPLIEAARYGTPIISRDIPVFREVAGEYAAYFHAESDSENLATFLSNWIDQYAAGSHVRSNGMPWLTWRESTKQLQTALDGKSSYREWLPDGQLRFWGNDLRFYTQVGRRKGVAMHSTGHDGFLVFGPYVALEPGNYTITFSGNAMTWSGSEWFDIACESGETQLLMSRLENMPKSDWSHTSEFKINNRISDLELRFWISAESQISLTGIVIMRSATNEEITDISIRVPGKQESMTSGLAQNKHNQSTHKNVSTEQLLKKTLSNKDYPAKTKYKKKKPKYKKKKPK